jgi:hypothetical protein
VESPNFAAQEAKMNVNLNTHGTNESVPIWTANAGTEASHHNTTEKEDNSQSIIVEKIPTSYGNQTMQTHGEAKRFQNTFTS